MSAVIQQHIKKRVREQTSIRRCALLQINKLTMEENLLNELENFASVKYLDDLTNNNNNNSSNHCCHDDPNEQVNNHISIECEHVRCSSLGRITCSSISD